jgi:hypothetical protein
VLVSEQRQIGRIGSDVAEDLAKEHGHDQRADERKGVKARIAGRHLAACLGAGDDPCDHPDDARNDIVMIAAARDRILGASSAKGMSAAAAWLSSASRSDATAARVNVHQGYAAFEVGFAIGAVATTYSSNRLAFPRPPRPCPETTSEACLQAISHRGFR